MNKAGRDRQSGTVLIFVAIALLVLVAMVGVAIDSSRAYLTRAKESAAVDGAAIAAGQAFTLGKTPAEQQTIAENSATAVFQANFPDGMASSAIPTALPAVQFTQNSGTTTIAVDAVRNLATSLSRVLKINALTVPAGATVTTGMHASRHKPSDVQVILDESESMYSMLRYARQGIATLAGRLDPASDRFSFSRFAGVPNEPIPFTAPAGFNQAKAIDWLRKPNVMTGNSHMFKGLCQASQDFLGYTYENLCGPSSLYPQHPVPAADPDRRRLLIIASDGMISNPVKDLQIAQILRAKGIQINTVGYGGANDLAPTNPPTASGLLQCMAGLVPSSPPNGCTINGDDYAAGGTPGKYCLVPQDGNEVQNFQKCFVQNAVGPSTSRPLTLIR